MRAFINRVLDATGKYNAWDFAFLKVCLVSLGVLLGAYYAKFFLNYTSILWVVFITTYLWIMYRTFFKYLK
jgi:small multidrug resistance family-3 protein